MVVDGAVARQHHRLVGHRQDHRGQRASASAPSCHRAGRCARSSRRTARRRTAAAAGVGSPSTSCPGRRKTTDPAVCPGAKSMPMRRPASSSGAAGSSSRTSSGALHSRRPPNSCGRPGGEVLHRVLELVAVVGVDPRRDALRPADRRDGEGVVEVAVRQQDRDRLQPVLAQDLVELGLDADARVDDDALLPRTGCDHVAVGVEGLGREPADEHGRPLERGATGAGPRRQTVLRPYRRPPALYLCCDLPTGTAHHLNRASSAGPGRRALSPEGLACRARSARRSWPGSGPSARLPATRRPGSAAGSATRCSAASLAAAVVGGAAVRRQQPARLARDEPTDSVAAAVETVATPSRRRRRLPRRPPRLEGRRSKAPEPPRPPPPGPPATPAAATRRRPSRPPARCCCPPTVGVETENLYTVTMATNRGDIVFEMDSAATPCTANNLRSLAHFTLLRRHGLPPPHDPGHRGPAVR